MSAPAIPPRPELPSEPPRKVRPQAQPAEAALAPSHAIYRFLFALAACAVAAGCLLPASELPLFEANDKVQHFGAFMALGAIGAIAFPGRRAMLWLALALFAFGCLLEGLQVFVPTRQASLGDVVADSVGIAAGLASGALALALLFARARLPHRPRTLR